MSELKATPGPWESKRHWGGGRLLIRKGCAQESLQIVPSEDAHLIAAAPEMYAELDGRSLNTLLGMIEDSGDAEMWAAARGFMERRYEVLAKARGES